jgi:hypothetical protein
MRGASRWLEACVVRQQAQTPVAKVRSNLGRVSGVVFMRRDRIRSLLQYD